jgi:hypothetical protein
MLARPDLLRRRAPVRPKFIIEFLPTFFWEEQPDAVEFDSASPSWDRVYTDAEQLLAAGEAEALDQFHHAL